MCVCVHVCAYACLCVQVCMGVYTCVEAKHRVSSSITSLPYLPEKGTHRVCSSLIVHTGWPLSGRDAPISAPTALELQICVALPGFYRGSGDSTLVLVFIRQPLD